jgi:dTDP-4-dehydrorhamnose 3,5-epimerase-like enzyme
MPFKLLDLKIMGDDRGSLIALEENKNIPFEIKRVYYIFGTRGEIRRGCHAHRDLQQVLICVSGQCTILLDDGTNQTNFILNDPSHGLIIGNMVWREMFDFSHDCVLLVLANKLYNPDDYIKDYEEFKRSLHQ